MKKHITHLTILLLTSIVFNNAEAKEVLLNLQIKTDQPMTVHYRFMGDNQIYGQGEFKNIKNGDTELVAVNRIPDDQSVLVQVYKMTVGNVTEINDPCEIRLEGANLTANITAGSQGNPPISHGEFTCSASEAQ